MDVPSSAIRIFLLGRFEVTRGERSLLASAWTRRKAAALLQRLALERRLLKEPAPNHETLPRSILWKARRLSARLPLSKPWSKERRH